MSKRFVVIIAGGRGERFWPQSRLRRPKYLLPIGGDQPLLAQTINRLGDLVSNDNIFVITHREQRDAVLKTCPQLEPGQVVGEPLGRDTAVAVCLATMLVRRQDPEGVFAVLPADHVIHDAEGFRAALDTAFASAEAEEALVTIGIEPRYPATGYGYIQKGEELGTKSGPPVFRVSRFVEKPDLEQASQYVESGEYFWNAGMFIWRASVIAAALENHAPALWASFETIDTGLGKGAALDELLNAHYPELEKISIDFAVMEKAERVLTVKGTFDWDDVGEWPAVARHHEADEQGNVVRGQALIRDGKGNIVWNESGHLTALIGVDDLVVVQTPDATLVCHKSKAQEVKKLLQQIEKNPDWEHLL